MGKSKSDTTNNFIANTIKNYDVVALQEVVVIVAVAACEKLLVPTLHVVAPLVVHDEPGDGEEPSRV